jgi:hypothetical protein
MSITEIIDTYCEVWSVPDSERQAALLNTVWGERATYTDPTVHAEGPAALLAHIAKVQARRPGSRVVRTSKVDEHHGVCRFAWRAIDAGGNALPEGIDFAEFSTDGTKIEKVVGFFGPLAPIGHDA